MKKEFSRTLNRPHIVVVGGGFAGLAAVRALRKADVQVTLVDKHPFNIFQPLLYQVATAALNPGDITWFLRAIRSKQKNVRFRRAEITGLDAHEQKIQLDDNASLDYDYLILSVGVTANFFGIPGAEEEAIPLYSRRHAIDIRDRIFGTLEKAAAMGQPRDVRIVVVGGGATGVETAGALAELIDLDLPVTYPELDTERIHVTLVERSPHVLAPFHPSLRRYAQRQLRKRGVDLRLDTAVQEVSESGVLIDSDGEEEFLEADLVIWASGVTARPVVNEWDLPQGRGGRIEVDEYLRVRGKPRVFAVGDAAVNPDEPLPQLAQPAVQGGAHAAKTIQAELRGEEIDPFRYVDKGTMATIGRASAIAQISHLPNLKGFPAWAIWVGVHIAELLGNRNRIATMVNLTQKYLGWKNHNLIVGQLKGRRPDEFEEKVK